MKKTPLTLPHRFALLTAALLTAALSACTGGGSSGSPATPGPGPGPTQAFGLLKPAESDEELAAALRQGMARNVAVAPAIDFSPAPQAPDAELAGDPGSFSTTNLQEIGVDEADRVKYDGEILYVSDTAQTGPVRGQLIAPLPPSTPVIRLYRTDPQVAGAEETGRIELQEGDAWPELYLRIAAGDKQLVSVSENYGFPHWGVFADFTYWQEQRTEVRGWDVADPAAPAELFSMEIEGALLTSRRVDNMLYVITRFSPVVDDLVPYPATEEARANNEAVL
ncbi:MAG: beta-propeller domain-containing protein, partial [Halioglobus sp.]|nr:beta-propeller domain-containing protein [Halioglobus sp.]